MSEQEQQHTEEQGTVNEEQLVPVGEAIKYRKRAQAAEQQVESLSEQLGEAQSQLATVGLEGELTRQLAAAGAVDLEVALLLARQQCRSDAEASNDVGAVVEQLRQKRPGLFASASEVVAQPTAGVRRTPQGPQVRLEQMAQRANQTQSRKDMQEYLRLRRSVRGAK